MTADPWPTPTHIVHKAYFKLFDSNCLDADKTNLVPDMPKG